MSKNKPTENISSKVLCGICGGIAVYKAAAVVRGLVANGQDVHVAMSAGACNFVRPLTFQALSGHSVATRLFPDPGAKAASDIFPHLYPASNTDVFVVLPATASMLARLATGVADEIVSASALALPEHCLRFFCPAMNTNMWQQSVVQANSAALEKMGWIRIGPDSGALACKDDGEGRMTQPEDIVATISSAITRAQSLRGRRVLILSGPTHEYLDPVRFIGNASSGRMGQALAREALLRGASVDFATGPIDDSRLPRGTNLNIYRVTSAQELLKTARSLFAQADIIIFAAAVADYAPAEQATQKAPKSAEATTITLVATPDIAATLCADKTSDQMAIGFALQDNNAIDNARAKLDAKNLDAIVLNSPAAIGGDTADYQFITSTTEPPDNWGCLSKSTCANRILDKAIHHHE